MENNEDRILFELAVEGNLEATRILLKSGVRAKYPNRAEASVLHYVAYDCVGDCMEIAHLLLKYGEDVNVTNINGTTPLHYAAMMGHLGMVQLLVAMGADVRVRNIYNMTPLHYAIGNDHCDVVDFLVEICSKTSQY